MPGKLQFLRACTEIESRISDKIEFRNEVDGKLTIVGSYYRFPDLEPMKKIEVDQWKVRECYHKLGKAWRVEVLLNGYPTGLHLSPIHLLNYARIIIEYGTIDNGIRVLRAKGSREEPLGRIPLFWRLLLVALRNWKYEKREKKYRAKKRDEVILEIQGIRENKASKHLRNSHVGDYNRSSQNLVTYQEAVVADDIVRTVHVPLEYQKPSYLGASKIVTISASDLDSEIQRWEHAIVGYLVGKDSQDHNVERYVKQNWKLFGYFETYLLKPGFFLFNFMNGADRFKLLEHGHQFINNIPFILKRWEPKLSLDPSNFLATLPVWVRFPCLDLQFWSPISLSKISSIIGKPLFSDEPTAKKENLKYARVCIEIEFGDKLPDIIHINLENHDTIIEQAVEYEWKPQTCRYCYSLSHYSSACALTRDADSRKTNDMDMDSLNFNAPSFQVMELNKDHNTTASLQISGKNGSTSYYSKIKNMLLTIKRHFLA